MDSSSTMEVDQPLDDIIKKRQARQRRARSGENRERGAAFTQRKAQASRKARLSQARGQAPKRQPRVARSFRSKAAFPAPLSAPMMSPAFVQPVPAPRPPVVVVPVVTARPPKTRGGRSQSMLTKAQKRALSQEISKITTQSKPVQFPTTFAPLPAPAPSRRQTSKVVKPSQPSQPVMLLPRTSVPVAMGPSMGMPPPMFYLPPGAQMIRPQQRAPQRRTPQTQRRTRRR